MSSRVDGKREMIRKDEGWTLVEGSRRKNGATRDQISTLLVTHFPENFNEKSMWKVFARWGEVVDIFIPKKRNNEGRIFGFVRMSGVDDPSHLARRIDQMFIGDMKLYVKCAQVC